MLNGMMGMKNRLFQVLVCLFLGMNFMAAAQAAITVDENYLDVDRISEDSLSAMRHLKIIFGHQSIGMNTIMGMVDLARQNNRYRLLISDVSSPADFNSPMFGHFKISVNGNPTGKIHEFTDRMKSGYGEAVDVAFFKFCPFDIKPNTDVDSLFNIYKKTMASLKSSYPDVTFIYVTCPLVDSEDLANVKRNQFNKMLLDEYSGREYIFDIAAIEAAYQNGGWATFGFGGQTYYKLCSAYRVAQDKVHLNNEGRERAAKGMIYLLATIAMEKK